MAVTEIAACRAIANGTQNGVTTSGAPVTTSGHSINEIVVGIAESHAGTSGQVQDNFGNTYVPCTNQNVSGSGNCRLWRCLNPITGVGHYWFYNGTNVYPAIGVFCFAGVLSGFDVESGNGDGSGAATSLQPGLVTPGCANEVVVTAIGFAVINTMTISGGGFSTVQQQVNFVAANSYGLAMAFSIQTTLTPSNPTWAWGSGSVAASAIAAFSPLPLTFGPLTVMSP
jgi:hypothetical protein